MAVKVTDWPVQIEVEEAAIDTDGVREAAAVIVATLEVAVSGAAHGALEVITTLTWSPFASVVEVKVGELEPTFVPLSLHW